jgi:cytochrome-b5 reductase
MPCAAGLLVAKELDAFSQVLDADKVQRPLTAIVGGAKIKDKILVLENLIDQADRIMCIGGMAYTFLKVSQGMAIGSSLFDKKGAEMVPRLIEKAKAKGCELVFPCDWLCGEEFKNEQPNGTKSVTQAEGIPDGWEGMDCGPASMALFREKVLASKTVISHDTRVFRFSLPSEKHVLGLPVGQHFFVKATVNGKAVIRAYTPVRDGEGWVDLLIKVYFANVHPRFPAGGLLTQHIDGLAIGDTIEVKGPIGHYSFPPQITGEPLCFNHVDKKKMQTFAKVGLIAGGSGITPVMQVATALLKDPATKVEVHILYANQTPTDILMADELNAIDKDARAHVWYTVDRPGGNPDHPLNADDWKYSTGFINEAMVKEHLPAPADDVCTFMCGPPMMLEKACIPNLKRVGHEEFNIFAF